jgi:hypothetical protein
LADVELAEKQRLTDEVIVTIPKNLVLDQCLINAAFSLTLRHLGKCVQRIVQQRLI